MAPLSSSGRMGLPTLPPSERRRARLFAVLALLVLVASTLVTSVARAETWTPPPLRGHVVDEARALSPEQARQLDMKLDRARRQTGFAVVVFLLPRLPEGLSIEDVGYTAGNAWGVGSKAGDDGVLLIASLGDRKLRIETGKGVGGALTDIESSRINRSVIGPLLRDGRTYEAIDRGVDAILRALVDDTPGGVSEPGRERSAGDRGEASGEERPMTAEDYVRLGVGGLVVLGILVLAIVSPTFRGILFFILLSGRSRGGRGGGGFGGGGGSGYGGGGGRFGGGGSSDDY